MARKRAKNWQLKVKESSRKWLSFLLVVFLIAFLLRFEVVAELVGGLTGIEPQKIQDVAGSIAMVTMGTILIVAGSIVAVPFVAPALIIAGSALVIWEAVRIFNRRSSKGKIEGGL